MIRGTRVLLGIDASDEGACAEAIARLALPAEVTRAVTGDALRCMLSGEPVMARSSYVSSAGRRLAWRYHLDVVDETTTAGRALQLIIAPEDIAPDAASAQPADELAARLVDASGVLVYVKDPQGRYTYANAALAAAYGMRAADILGRSDVEMFGATLAQRQWAAEQHVLEAEASVIVEGPLPVPNNGHVYVALKFALVADDGTPTAVASIATDVTERAERESAAGRSADRLMVLNDCFLSFGPDPDENMRRLVTLSKDLLGGSFALYQRAGRGMISSVGLWSAPSASGEDGAGGRLCDAVLARASDEVQVIRRLQESPYYRTDPNVAQYGLRTHVGRIVRLGERVLGALCIAYQRDYEPSAEDKRLLGIVASELAVEERRLRAEERQAVAYGIAEAASRSVGLRELGGYIHQELQRLLEARNFYLALADPAGRRLVFPYYVDENLPLGTERAPRPYDGGLTELVLHGGNALLLHEDDIRALVRKGTVKVIGTLPRVWLGVPLMDGDEPVGMMAVQSYSCAQAYDQEDLEFLVFVSGQVAATVKGKRAGDALAQSEQRYRLLAEHVSDIIWARDANLRLTYVSASVERVLGFTVEEALAQSVEEALAPESVRLLRAAADELIALADSADGDRTLDLEQYRKDGSTVWTEVKMSLQRDRDGHPQGILGVTRDITQRRELDRQYLQINKMESLGQLAGGIAHHFNNLLTVINGYSQFMLTALGENDPVRRDAESILKAGRRAAELTRQLLDFSRRRVLHPDVLDLNELMPETADMLHNVIGDNVRLRLSLGEGVPYVRVDPGQIEQVALNLAVNARDAMPEGGLLTISTRAVDAADVQGASVAPDAPRQFAELAVSDTGCGMTPEVREHLFEPFFTTKEVGEGTGLGLATVYGIVTQAGGQIAVETAPGVGTTFRIYLPAVADQPEDRSDPPSSDAAPGGHEVILVLEDEQDVRELAVRMLDRLGYTVLAAANGAAGLQMARSSARPVDLVLADVVMPDTRAVDFVRTLRGENPLVRVLYMSGYSEGSVLGREVEDARAPFIGKPFTLLRLAQKVRQVLDSP